MPKAAGIAQPVEQLIRNQQVACSSHVSSSKPIKTNLFPSERGSFFAIDSTDQRPKNIRMKSNLPFTISHHLSNNTLPSPATPFPCNFRSFVLSFNKYIP